MANLLQIHEPGQTPLPHAQTVAVGFADYPAVLGTPGGSTNSLRSPAVRSGQTVSTQSVHEARLRRAPRGVCAPRRPLQHRHPQAAQSLADSTIGVLRRM